MSFNIIPNSFLIKPALKQQTKQFNKKKTNQLTWNCNKQTKDENVINQKSNKRHEIVCIKMEIVNGHQAMDESNWWFEFYDTYRFVSESFNNRCRNLRDEFFILKYKPEEEDGIWNWQLVISYHISYGWFSIDGHERILW